MKYTNCLQSFARLSDGLTHRSGSPHMSTLADEEDRSMVRRKKHSPEERGGLAHVLQPANTLLFLDRHPGRVDPALERGRPLELRPCPELDRRQPQRQPV